MITTKHTKTTNPLHNLLFYHTFLGIAKKLTDLFLRFLFRDEMAKNLVWIDIRCLWICFSNANYETLYVILYVRLYARLCVIYSV